jgi:hypothetical protein
MLLFSPPKADIVTRCADNTVVAGAVPAWWILRNVELGEVA